MISTRLILLAALLGAAACRPSDAPSADAILKNIPAHAGKHIRMKAKLRNGARCRQATEGEWKTYCKDCQVCRGPVVVVTELSTAEEGLDDWPMILGGVHDGKPIRCSGPLNEVTCHPFDLDKTYILEGLLENQRPPRLMVAEFWEVE